MIYQTYASLTIIVVFSLLVYIITHAVYKKFPILDGILLIGFALASVNIIQFANAAARSPDPVMFPIYAMLLTLTYISTFATYFYDKSIPIGRYALTSFALLGFIWTVPLSLHRILIHG